MHFTIKLQKICNLIVENNTMGLKGYKYGNVLAGNIFLTDWWRGVTDWGRLALEP